MSDRLYIKYGDIQAPIDYGLLEPSLNDGYFVVFLSFYGNHSICQAIFSALATYTTLKLSDGKEVFRDEFLHGKTRRIGYGKYNMIAYSGNLQRDYIIQYPGESETDAWVRYLEGRKIPFKKEWIPAIKKILLSEGELTECFGIGGIKCWKTTMDDDRVCDLIVKHIYKDTKTETGISAIARKHGLSVDVLQDFVEKILRRMIFDAEALTEILEPLGLDWKTRTRKELELMEDLTPLLQHLAKGKEISGLDVYKEAV
jgi:hypothetical protein